MVYTVNMYFDSNAPLFALPPNVSLSLSLSLSLCLPLPPLSLSLSRSLSLAPSQSPLNFYVTAAPSVDLSLARSLVIREIIHQVNSRQHGSSGPRFNRKKIALYLLDKLLDSVTCAKFTLYRVSKKSLS